MEWLFDEGNGRPPAYFVPHEHLKPIESLKEVAYATSESYNR